MKINRGGEKMVNFLLLFLPDHFGVVW